MPCIDPAFRLRKMSDFRFEFSKKEKQISEATIAMRHPPKGSTTHWSHANSKTWRRHSSTAAAVTPSRTTATDQHWKCVNRSANRMTNDIDDRLTSMADSLTGRRRQWLGAVTEAFKKVFGSCVFLSFVFFFFFSFFENQSHRQVNWQRESSRQAHTIDECLWFYVDGPGFPQRGLCFLACVCVCVPLSPTGRLRVK